MPTLTQSTNATGYVTFQKATAGSYTFHISKEGYPEMNETIPYNATPLILTVNLSDNSNTASTDPSNTLVIIVSVAIVVAAVSVISTLFIVQRKKSPNVKKLQEMKKQMKSKYESQKTQFS